DGTVGKTSLQVGASSNQTIEFEIGKMDTQSLGLGSGADIIGAPPTTGDTLHASLIQLADNDMKVNGASTGDLTTFDGTNSLQDILNSMNSSVSSVTFGAVTSFTAASV